MTETCLDWLAHCVKTYPCSGPVLEVGSMDVNGNPRHLFANKQRFDEYTGIDMREGRCVDMVMNAQHLAFPDGHFGVIVDSERMEHDDRFWVTIKELFRVLRSGGYLLITTRSWGAFPPHGYPSDYWRFLDTAIKNIVEYAGFKCLATAYGEIRQGPRAVFGIAQKQ